MKSRHVRIAWVLALAFILLSVGVFAFGGPARPALAGRTDGRMGREASRRATQASRSAPSSCVSLTDVVLHAPRQALTDTAQVLQAVVSPITADQPITYYWTASAQSPVTRPGGVSDTLAFTWTLPGPQWVTVTAENPCGNVVSTGQEILLQDAFRVYLPLVSKPLNACQPIPETSYTAISVVGGQPPNPDAAHDADFNVNLLDALPVNEHKGLFHYGGDADPQAPQLIYLFGDKRVPEFSAVYEVYHNGNPASSYDVSMVDFAVEPLEIIRVPDRFQSIPDHPVVIDPRGYKVFVLYAGRQSITLKYSREDGLGGGYAIHVAGICTEPSLLALYEQKDAEGRGYLPALEGQQPFGRAWGEEIRVAIRDQGAIMDPRSEKDWWQHQ